MLAQRLVCKQVWHMKAKLGNFAALLLVPFVWEWPAPQSQGVLVSMQFVPPVPQLCRAGQTMWRADHTCFKGSLRP